MAGKKRAAGSGTVDPDLCGRRRWLYDISLFRAFIFGVWSVYGADPCGSGS